MATGGAINRPLAVLIAVGYLLMMGLIVVGIMTEQRVLLAKQRRKSVLAQLRRR